jgi:hypothetical protein
MKNQFIKGLNNGNLINQLRTEDTSKMSICEVKDLAKRLHNTYSNYVEKASFQPTLTKASVQQSDSNPPPTNTATAQAPTSLPKVSFAVCNYCKRYNHTENECRNKLRDLNRSDPNSNNSRQTSNTNQYSSSNSQQANHETSNLTRANANLVTAKPISQNEIMFKSDRTAEITLKNLTDEIGGVCLIDDKEVNFMADTGCTLTIVDRKVLENASGTIDDI